MPMERHEICLGFTPDNYLEGTHICYLYSDDEERRRFLRAFISSGITGHESVHYVADVPTPEDLERVIDDLAIREFVAERRDQLQVATSISTYCPDAQFNPDTALDRVRDMYVRGQGCGYVGTRGSGEMSWALHGIPGSDRLVEYEARINNLVKDVPITILCQYDTRKFDGATIFDILNVHPIMIVRGQIMRNPFYVPPDRFFAERYATTGRQ
jgi:hypothetical protein